MKFSIAKFESLDQSRKERKILQFIQEIEKTWEKIDIRSQLIKNFHEYLTFFNTPEYKAIAVNLLSGITRRDFLNLIAPLEQSLHHQLKDHQLQLKKLDGQRDITPQLPLILVLDNLRSSFNVGSIIRSAECFGVREIFFCGYTPDNKTVSQTAMGTRELMQAQHFPDTKSAILKLRADDHNIYALETATGSDSLYDYKFNFPAALIAGNEALGISPEILAMVDAILEIPLTGWKNSLNVASATAIALSEFYRRKIL